MISDILLDGLFILIPGSSFILAVVRLRSFMVQVGHAGFCHLTNVDSFLYDSFGDFDVDMADPCYWLLLSSFVISKLGTPPIIFSLFNMFFVNNYCLFYTTLYPYYFYIYIGHHLFLQNLYLAGTYTEPALDLWMMLIISFLYFSYFWVLILMYCSIYLGVIILLISSGIVLLGFFSFFWTFYSTYSAIVSLMPL